MIAIPRWTALGSLLGASSVLAQASANTTAPRVPTTGPLVVPSVRASSLPNGIGLRVVEHREVPLVQVTLSVEGGARLDGASPGLATFMAGMLDEGAGSRDALALQGELAYLGANLTTSADWDRFTVSLKVPVRSLGPALAIMADVIQRPRFGADDLRRQRDLRLAALLQARDQPGTLANLAFNQAVFPAAHPYYRNPQGDSASVAMFDSAMVRRFYDGTMRPERARLFVVGDISEADARTQLARHLGSWRSSGPALAIPRGMPVAEHPATTRVTLVDKPGAAQSVVFIGWPGVERTSPDYAALTVMNTILGGSFTSRLNMNLRETKGYSYGAGSGFTYRVVPGPFSASAQVRTNVTDSSLVEFFKEIRALRDVAVPSEELERAKSYVEYGIPGGLESTSQVASQMAQLDNFGLTLEELPRLVSQLRAVTSADVQRVARQYLTPDKAHVVVVGDLSKVRAGIEALSLGPIEVREVGALVGGKN